MIRICSIIVGLLVLHFSVSKAIPCRSSDYVEMKTNCINGLQTLLTMKKPDTCCTGETSIIVGLVSCSLKKASLSDRYKALLADIGGFIISNQILYHFDKVIKIQFEFRR